MGDGKDPKPSLSNSVKGPQPGLRYRAMVFQKPEPVPDFIDVPPHLKHRANYRSHEITDIPRDVFQKGKINLDKMPIRGTEHLVQFKAIRWMKDTLEQDGKTHLTEQWGAIEKAFRQVHPPKLLKKLGQLDRWLDEQSTDKFREKMQEVPGLRAEDMTYLVATYKGLVPKMHEEVQGMANYLIAMEYHLPHYTNIDRDR